MSSVSDPALKAIAFQKILDDLLGDGETKNREPAKTSKTSSSRENKKRLKVGPKAHVESLVEEKFFKNKKTSAEVISELGNRTIHITSADVGKILIRLCEQRKLRRKLEGSVYYYSNW